MGYNYIRESVLDLCYLDCEVFLNWFNGYVLGMCKVTVFMNG